MAKAPVLIVSTFYLFTATLLALYSLLLLMLRYHWLSVNEFVIKPGAKPRTQVSVIIAARNEAANIEALLKSLKDQAYPAELYEVIIVDDFSEDDTALRVSKYPMENLRLIKMADHPTGEQNSFKKRALETAIQQATGKLIVTTDADCIVPENWLMTIAAAYEQYGWECIVMPVKYMVKKGWLHIFQWLDFMSLQGVTGAGIIGKMVYMCNGANLAYTQKAFYAVQGFTGVDEKASGDDMFLLHKLVKQYPEKIGYLKSTDVIVSTKPAGSWRAFLHQRIRWASKANSYTNRKVMMVALIVYLLNLSLIAWIPVLFFYPAFLWKWILLVCIKNGIELLFLWPVAGFFSSRKWLTYFTVAQLPHIFYTVLAGGLGLFGSYEWKGRKVK